jgi:predicted transcriptional regulator
MNDARLLFKLSKDRLDTYGFNFESPTVPQQVKGKINQDEWNMLRDLHSRGIIQAVTSIDSGANLTRTLGELNNSLPPNAAQAGAKILEASSFMFGAIEQINRITTALTAYRLAKKSPSNLKKLDDYSKYTVYSTRKTTPTQAAEMMVMKTQFLISKENRPELFHKGFLNVATQFMPYVINYVGLYAQALSIAKVDKKLGSALLGSMVLSMLFFAGAMGLPWMENMKQLLQMLSKEVSDYEFDLETGMRQTLANFGITGVANDILMSGVFGQLTGIDLRRRVGVGEVIPFDLMAGDLSVAYGPTGSVVIDSARKAREALKQKEFNAVEFATAFLPIGVRNAYDAAATQFLDKPVRTTQGRVLMPSKEIGTLENLAKAFGFTPKSVAEARQQRQYYKFLQGETKGIQDYYYSQLAKHINLANLEYTKGDMSNYKKQTDIVRDIYKEIADLNREAATEKRPDLIINIQSEALRNRIATELLGQTDRGVAMRSIRKNARPMAEEATLRRLGLLTRD